MSSSDDYKRQVMKDLAGGDKEMLPDESTSEDYQSLDDFAQRSSHDEHH
ncbi:hypothetical protein AB3R30_20320 [Leptolyngbyaceae cyanobacterium UHCC 1019]